jgi:uncharacterized protein (TIGR03435 family)
MIRTVAACLCLVSIVALAQPSAPPSFEVASVRAGEPGRGHIEALPGRLTMQNVRLISCICWAYDVPEQQISGPAWLNETGFSIFAKADTPAAEGVLRQMLQTLLAERFHLVVHRQTKEISAYVLVVAKNGHKLEPTEVEGSPSFQTGKLNLTGKGATVGQLIEFLSRELREPILDQTGLTGRFNYFLDINAYVSDELRQSNGAPPEAAGIIALAMQSQLGLKLEGRKVPVEMLIIDRVDREPTEN